VHHVGFIKVTIHILQLASTGDSTISFQMVILTELTHTVYYIAILSQQDEECTEVNERVFDTLIQGDSRK
jgi:hypothetical protein